MKKNLFLLFLLLFTIFFRSSVFATEDPRIFPNNKIGIHILFPSEIEEAAKLVNSNGGDWGYVTIPIQAGDKDIMKWQKFMDQAKKHHVTPLIRLASEGDYFNTKVWRKPTDLDILDFANFLDSLEWPIKNRYVIVFNEPNRSDEWGGEANPSEYAKILSYGVTVFKSKNQDFFIISAGMDNAAENTNLAFNQYTFLKEMEKAVPGIFYQVDGLGSHSYPNPGFSQPPARQDKRSIASFRFEKTLIDSLGARNQPIFITETGWSKKTVTESLIENYYKEAFENVWNDPNIAAVTPFLLRANAGPFEVFSFLKPDGSKTTGYIGFESIEKIKGEPTVVKKVLGKKTPETLFQEKNFKAVKVEEKSPFSLSTTVKSLFKRLLRI